MEREATVRVRSGSSREKTSHCRLGTHYSDGGLLPGVRLPGAKARVGLHTSLALLT